MYKAWLLKLHRWITLVFSLPLAVVILTGLILSFEPVVTGSAIAPDAITAEQLGAVLAKHDPDGKARGLFVRAYAGTVSIAAGAQPGAMTHVDLATNAKIDNPGFLVGLFSTSRRLHETLLLDLGWLVTASTIAMLVLTVLGVLMGLPRLRNTMSGWHKGAAWIGLPLVVLSPLTGLCLAFGITFAGAPSTAATQGRPPALAEAVKIIDAEYDLSAVSWIRPRGNAVMVRLDDAGEMRVFGVTNDGLKPMPRSWPRLIHEGTWSGALSAAINVVTSFALMVLFATGMVIWSRRTFRKPQRQRVPRTA